MKENRVKVRNYGRIPGNDGRLVAVPTKAGAAPQRLHWAAAAALDELRQAAEGAGYDLRVVSGWRKHKWLGREDYEAHLIRRYGSVKRGRKWLAYDSPHETGLAFDLGTHGLEPRSATASYQKQQPVYAWLEKHAARFGITPYIPEPWHWEVKIPKLLWIAPGPGAPLVLALVAAAAVVYYYVS